MPEVEQGNQVYAHKMVVETAQEFANLLYDEVMGDNFIRTQWKAQHPGMSEIALRKQFVARNLVRCLTAARTTLASMLNAELSPNLDEKQKESIHEALLLDAVLIRGKRRNDQERFGP